MDWYYNYNGVKGRDLIEFLDMINFKELVSVFVLLAVIGTGFIITSEWFRQRGSV